MNFGGTQIFGIQKTGVSQQDWRNSRDHSPDRGESSNVNGKKYRRRLRVNNGTYKEGRWTAEEHAKFVKSCLINGNNWKKVQKDVKTRSSAQIRSHAQKFVIRLCRRYNLKMNNKRFDRKLNNHSKNNLSEVKHKEEMDEEDKKILEMFNCFRKKPIVMDSEGDLQTGESQEIKEDSGIFLQEKVKKKSPRNKNFMTIISQKIQKRKQIFKIQKTNKRPDDEEEQMPFINEDNLKEFINILSEIQNLSNYNERIMLSLLQQNSLESDKQNLISLVEENSNMSELTGFNNFEHLNFIQEMNYLLDKWGKG